MKIKSDGLFFTFCVDIKESIKCVIETEKAEKENPHFVNCCICNYTLEQPFVFILQKLHNNGLLPHNYHPLCCGCWNIKQQAKVYGKATMRCVQNLKMVKQRWKKFFPELNIKVVRQKAKGLSADLIIANDHPRFYRIGCSTGSIFLAHQIPNLCEFCTRKEDCSDDVKDNWGRRGECNGYVPIDDAISD